jgi:hypothetical protein
MRTSKVKNIALLSAVIVFGICAYAQAISFTVGSGNYYVSVGDHDYLPYAYNSYPGYQQPGYQQPGYQQPGLSFQSTMADYGTWVSMQPFGNVWRPYVAAGWRPYTQGHWTYTQYGPTWEGYEPWAWAGYHYGNWVFSNQYGWVWIPGYDYHSGQVAWAQGYNSLGWMPLPPAGYDYSRGYLSYMGPTNQFSYNDSDFSIGFGIGTGNNDYYYNGGPYYDPRYRDLYYNQNYLNSGTNLWTFIDPNNFGSDNYADYYYGGDYARDLFDRHLVRISTRPLDRVVVERIVRQPIQVENVRVNEVQIDGHPVRLVAVQGEEEKIRKNANRVAREVIAPAFAEKGRTFKGKESKAQGALDKAFHQENAAQQVETVNSDDIVREARQNEQRQEQHRTQIKQTKREEISQVEKQGKIREKNNPGQLKKEEDTRTRNSSVTPVTPPPQDQNDRRNRQVDQTPDQQQQQEQQNRKNRQIDQTPPEEQQRIDQERRQNEEHSNTRPSDENSNQRNEPNVKSDKENPDNNPDNNEPNVKSDKENPDKNVNANDEQKQSDNNKKKAKAKKSKKDKNNNNPDQPPQD